MTAKEYEGVHLFLAYSSWGMAFNLCKAQADADPVWNFEVLLKCEADGKTHVQDRGFGEGPVQPRGTQLLLLSPVGEQLSSSKCRT